MLGWRDLPIQPDCLGATARAAMPTMKQFFVAAADGASGIDLDRKTFVARKRAEHELAEDLTTYFSSLSARTIVYKGMLTTPQLGQFFPDLVDPRVESALLLVHSRFSTNTFPSWPLAHPYRFIAHNGEINTVQGNQNWMRAREAMASSPHLPNLAKAFPICTPGASDTARFDEVLELLHLAGRPIQHAILMMIPEAWENNAEMDADKRAFYRYHSSMMEPWDGPASVTFTDGTVIGAVLDRNGLRPSRYWVTDDDLVVMASEVGVIDIDPAKIVTKGRLQPGKMFLIDTAEGRIVDDEEIKGTLAAEHPYAEWLEQGMARARRPARARARRVQPSQRAAPPADVRLHARGAEDHRRPDGAERRRADRIDGHRHADRRAVGTATAVVRLLPAAVRAGHEPAARRDPRGGRHGGGVDGRARRPTCSQPGPENCRQLALPFPIIDNDELARIIHADDDGGYPGLKSHVVKGLYRVAGGGDALRAALETIFDEVSRAIDNGARDHRALRPQRRRGRRADPVAAAHVGGAPPPRAHQAAHDGRAARRVRRRPRGAPHGVADRVRRRCDQPVPGVRVDRGPDRRRRGARSPRTRRDGPEEGGPQLHQGVRQGRAEGDVEDGRLHRRQLHRCPDLRSDRTRRGADRAVLHRHREPPRRDRPRRAGGRDRGPPRDRQPEPSRGAGPPQARARRRVPVAPRGRAPPVQPGDRVQAAARHAGQALRHLQGVHLARRRPGASPGDVARPVPVQDRRTGRRSRSTRSSR